MDCPVKPDNDDFLKYLLTGVNNNDDSLFHPVSNKNISGPRSLRISIRREGEFFPVRGKHREPVEYFVVCDPLKAAAVDVDQVKLKVVSVLFSLFPPVVHVAGKNEPFAVRMP